MNWCRLGVACLGLSAAALLAGCGPSGPKRYAVSGTVTLKGQPVKYGSIRFVPANGQGVDAGATVRDGQFEIPAEIGLFPGECKVTLTAPSKIIEGSSAEGIDPAELASVKELMPPKYQNVNETPLTVTVKAGEPNVFPINVD